MNSTPKVSIVIPFHWMKDWQKFLVKCLQSVEEQSFNDYEIVLMKVDSMPVTSNRVIRAAKGELIKVLYMDDSFSNPNSLKRMVELMDLVDNKWLIVGANTNPKPYWTDDIETGNNHLGSPSVLMMRRNSLLTFDEKMSWLLDCDLYKRLRKLHGEPAIFQEVMINIGEHEGQMTHILTDEEKLSEHNYMKQKYA